MSGSVGVTKIPLVSTFDPTGVNQAKAGLKELQRAGGGGAPGGGGGGGGGGGARPPAGKGKGGIGGMLGLGDAIGSAAGEFGIGALAGAGSVGSAATALYGISQAAASSAIELKHSAREAGVGIEYYSKLGVASRKAGIGIDETLSGMKKAHASFESASLNGDVAEGLFLHSLGLTDRQIAAGMDNAESMANMLRGKNLSGGQTASLFGSYGAGKAAMGAGGEEGSFFDPTAGQALAAARLKQHTSGFVTELGGAGSQQIRAFMHGHLSSSEEANADEKEARDQEEAEVRHRAEAERLNAAKQRVNQVANPAEQFQAAVRAIGNMNFRAAAGDQGDRMQGLAINQAKQQQLSAERPYLDPREAAEREWQNTHEKASLGGFADQFQGRRAEIDVERRLNATLAPTRSAAENLRGSLSVNSQEYAVASDAEYRRLQALPLPQLSNLTQRRNGPNWLESDDDMKAPGESGAMVDAARKMGDSISDFAQGMTSAGPQAGAYGVNTVQGASQMMGVEYQMDQSKEQLNMLGAILNQLVVMGKMDKDTARSTYRHAGDRNNDPISQLFGDD